MITLSRDWTRIVCFFLDNICPPFLRDCKWFMYPIFYITCGKKAKMIMGFKEKFPFLTEDEIGFYYKEIKDIPIFNPPSDINKNCVDYIIRKIKGTSVLDAACGRGMLLKTIYERNSCLKCMGVDIMPPSDINAHIQTAKGSLTSLPFESKSFDTVICTHALEHIKEYKKALTELIRVTSVPSNTDNSK